MKLALRNLDQSGCSENDPNLLRMMEGYVQQTITVDCPRVDYLSLAERLICI